METQGTMLLGTEMTAAIVALEAMPIDVLGMNCATGPELNRGSMWRCLAISARRVYQCAAERGLPVLHEGIRIFRFRRRSWRRRMSIL